MSMHPLFAEICQRHFPGWNFPEYAEDKRQPPEPAPDEQEQNFETDFEVLPIQDAVIRGLVGEDEINPDVVSLRRANFNHPEYLPLERGYLVFKNGSEKRLY